jgi:hypothetical protein
MDIAEAEGGGSALIQIRVSSSAPDACSRVTKAIELAVRMACESAGEPVRRVQLVAGNHETKSPGTGTRTIDAEPDAPKNAPAGFLLARHEN